jgi:predicted RNA-binding Zn-ribbon protein involved in translation (DUF1610 family)
MRIVDAENIKGIICKITNDAIEKNQTKATIQKRLIMAVEKMPTLDVRKDTQGKWKKSDIPESVLSKCSVCGFQLGAYSFNFCPKCGAEMRGMVDNSYMKNVRRDCGLYD